jgi:diadenosine tetraphosphate (Ap4A) HIT family hydrolase
MADRQESTWPDDWSERIAGKDCPMCRGLGKGDNEHAVHVYDGTVTEVHLARHTSVRGYCVVIWKGAHVADPMDLEPADVARYWMEVLEVGRAVRTVYQPMKINYSLLGNFVPHLHTHVVPRYLDDPAPGGPLSWERLVEVPATPAEQLHRDADTLRAVLARSTSG